MEEITKKRTVLIFLGFTIHDGKTRNGYYKVDYTTNEKKSKQKKQNLKEYIKTNMHIKPVNLIKGINRILIGLYNYYGISFNMKWLQEIYHYVIKMLKKYLCRRSQKDKTTWEKLKKMLYYNPIVKPKITFNLW